MALMVWFGAQLRTKCAELVKNVYAKVCRLAVQINRRGQSDNRSIRNTHMVPAEALPDFSFTTLEITIRKQAINQEQNITSIRNKLGGWSDISVQTNLTQNTPVALRHPLKLTFGSEYFDETFRQKLYQLAFDLKVDVGIIAQHWENFPFYRWAIKWTRLKAAFHKLTNIAMVGGMGTSAGVVSLAADFLFGPIGLSSSIVLLIMSSGVVGGILADFNNGFSDAKTLAERIDSIFAHLKLPSHGTNIVMNVFDKFSNFERMSADKLFDFLREEIVRALTHYNQKRLADELDRIMIEYSSVVS